MKTLKHLLKALILSLFICSSAFAGVQLDGSDDLVTIADSASVSIADKFSISFWVKESNWGNYPFLVSKDSTTNDSSSNYRIEYYAGVLYLTVGGGGATSQQQGYSWSPSNNVWYNIIVTWSQYTADNALVIYVNGVVLGSTTGGNFNANDNLVAVEIGSCTVKASNRRVTGTMVEYAEWHAFLTQAEATQLQSRVKGTPLQVRPSLLVAYLPMDDQPDGTSLDGDSSFDRSGNGNHGINSDGANNTGLTSKAEEILSYP